MELDVGMYIRTKSGMISKIIKITKDNIFFDSKIYNNRFNFDLDNKYLSKEKAKLYIIKASEDITELIEVGDYVNGYEVTSKDQFLGFGNHDWYIADYEIKSIVTKEQFKYMSYRVEE